MSNKNRSTTRWSVPLFWHKNCSYENFKSRKSENSERLLIWHFVASQFHSNSSSQRLSVDCKTKIFLYIRFDILIMIDRRFFRAIRNFFFFNQVNKCCFRCIWWKQEIYLFDFFFSLRKFRLCKIMWNSLWFSQKIHYQWSECESVISKIAVFIVDGKRVNESCYVSNDTKMLFVSWERESRKWIFLFSAIWWIR